MTRKHRSHVRILTYQRGHLVQPYYGNVEAWTGLDWTGLSKGTNTPGDLPEPELLSCFYLSSE